MAADAPALYEPMLERDADAIRRSALLYAESNSVDELFLAVARFAILAYAPSQHGKHAVIAALCAHELREELGPRWRDLIIECAIYAASARQPWSEPPILEMPHLARNQRGDVDELREAVATQDRPRAERWLAKRLADPLPDLFTVASEDDEDFGHKLIVAVSVWKLAAILGEKGRYAALRVAVWEMTAYRGSRSALASLEDLIDRCVAERGSYESAHAVFLYEARESVEDRRSRLSGQAGLPVLHVPIYTLETDFAQHLEAHAVAKRLRERHPDARFDAFLTATRQNLEATQ